MWWDKKFLSEKYTGQVWQMTATWRASVMQQEHLVQLTNLTDRNDFHFILNELNKHLWTYEIKSWFGDLVHQE